MATKTTIDALARKKAKYEKHLKRRSIATRPHSCVVGRSFQAPAAKAPAAKAAAGS